MESMIKGFILLSIFAAIHDLTALMMREAAHATKVGPMSYGAYTRMLTK